MRLSGPGALPRARPFAVLTFMSDLSSENLLSRPPHRGRSDRGWCRGVRGSDEAELVLVEVAA
jgi:hypothetical protein